MLESLRRMGLVDRTDHGGYHSYRISGKGRELLGRGASI